jgi:hypothetical protein
MRLPQFHLVELLLAVVFIGFFAGLAARTWGGFFIIHGLLIAATLLFPAYLLLVIMMRQHRNSRGTTEAGNRSWPDA